MATMMAADDDDNNVNGNGATGNKVDDDGNGATGRLLLMFLVFISFSRNYCGF
jgi:hypothetical protein